MTSSNGAVPATEPDTPKSMPPGACIDLDRFCEECGYNLRTRPVQCEPRTGIVVVRCPECGRFQAANHGATALRPWLDRATSVVLFLWMLLLLAAIVHLGLAQGALSYLMLDELTVPGGTIRTQVDGFTTVYQRGSGPLVVWTDFEDFVPFVITMIIGSAGAGFGLGMLATLVFPHWRGAYYAALTLGIPVLANVIVSFIWHYEAPHLLMWGVQIIAAHAGAQAIGGTLGVVAGRPLARLAVRVLLPPGLHPRLAYLWLADNKPVPPRPAVPNPDRM